MFIDPATGKIEQTLALPAAAKGLAGAFSAVGLVAAGDRVFATDSQGAVRIAKRKADGTVRLGRAPRAEGAGGRRGRVSDRDRPPGRLAGVGLRVSRQRTATVEPRRRRGRGPRAGRRRPVRAGRGRREGVRLELGRRPPGEGRPAAQDLRHAGEDRPANERREPRQRLGGGEGRDGWKQAKTITVGGHPSGITASKNGKFVYVANANSDTVSVIDTATDAVVETIDCKPEAKLPFGTGSNAVALSPDGRTLYVANGTGNCVAVVALGSRAGGPPPAGDPRASRIAGMIPTGWYPGAGAAVRRREAIVRREREGTRLAPAAQGRSESEEGTARATATTRPPRGDRGKNSHDHLGSVSPCP